VEGMNKTIIIWMIMVFCLIYSVYGQCPDPMPSGMVLCYGFEDWTGDMYTTPGYPITSGYSEYMEIHDECTEVISSYDANEMDQTWTPHSGEYYLLLNRHDAVPLNPSVPGITSGSVNSRSNLAYGGEFGGLNKINIESAITTGELFIRFWARFNRGHYGIFVNRDGDSSNPYPGMKFIRVHTDDNEPSSNIFMSINTDGVSPKIYIAQTSSGGSHGSIIVPNAYDGNWHKFSMYIDFNNGIVKQWYDVGEETLDNAIQTWDNDGPIGDATHVTYVSLKGNFAAKYPVNEIYSGLDDIEVWDRIPSNEPPICGDDWCNGAEDCDSCPEDCTDCPIDCIHDAEFEPCDGVIDIDELIDYVQLWLDGDVTIGDLIEAIKVWKG